ncbi:MAG: substrate-binding domain-containing protein [Herpetosiphon sp.]
MNGHKARSARVGAILALSLGLAACGSPATTSTSSTTTSAGNSKAATAAPAAAGGAAAGDPAAALKALENKVLSVGPNGESATAASEIKLTDDEIAKIKGMKATAAIVLHIAGNDWSTSQSEGLKDQFTKMGIEVIATTNANFKAEQQVADIETVLAKKPSIIVSIPTDPVATADAYKKAAAAGVKLVFMDNVPKGLKQGTDYVSVVSADNYGNGVATAHLMAQALKSKGKIGIVFHAADFFVTRQRYDAFKKTIQDNYKDIQIVEEQGIAGPDFAGDADRAAAAMLTKHADLAGIWAVWDAPAEGVMSAVRTAGRNEVAVTTIDLGKTVAIELAKGGIIKGIGGQRPYDQGVTEALLAGYGLLGKQAPPYVAENALPITKATVRQAWTIVYHKDPPAELKP